MRHKHGMTPERAYLHKIKPRTKEEKEERNKKVHLQNTSLQSPPS